LNNDQYFTIQEAADFIGKSTQTIRRMIKSGKFKAKRSRTPQGFNYAISKKEFTEALGISLNPTPAQPAINNHPAPTVVREVQNSETIATEQPVEAEKPTVHPVKKVDQPKAVESQVAPKQSNGTPIYIGYPQPSAPQQPQVTNKVVEKTEVIKEPCNCEVKYLDLIKELTQTLQRSTEQNEREKYELRSASQELTKKLTDLENKFRTLQVLRNAHLNKKGRGVWDWLKLI